MKKVFLLTAFLFTACSQEVESNLNDHALNAAMAYGHITKLNDIDPTIEKNLLVRLYQVPVLNGDCFIETHGTCKNSYLISVSTFDENPEVNVFKLAMAGEVIETHWVESDEPDVAEIEFVVNKYTQAALKNNSTLQNEQTKTLVKLSPTNYSETSK